MHRRELNALLLGLGLPGWAFAAPARTAAPRAVLTSTPEAALRLAARLRSLDADGLAPRFYDVPPDSMMASDPQGHVLALQAAAVAALADLLCGRVGALPGRPDIRRDLSRVNLPGWVAELHASAEPAEVVERAALLPPDMALLRAALQQARARVEAGGWASVPPGATLDPGMEDADRVPYLRARVRSEDAELAAAPDAGAIYDPALEAAVRRWQAAHALEADGRVGPATLRLLNRTAEAWMGQIRVAMDMRRGVAPPPPGRRVEVNIPEFRLWLIDGGKVVLDMPVVVGKPARATPPLAVQMTSVQFNPPWGVPERNAKEDLLPRFRRDPRAMMEKGFRVFQYIGGERVEIDPMTVDWAAVNPQRFPFLIRQDASEISALGRLKFIMPNGDDIYLHDTPDRGLFARADRAGSSGCIRLSRPMDMLEAVLTGIPGWDKARAQAALDSRNTSFVSLPRPIPVRLRYETVVIDAGRVRMLPDLYGLDAAYLRLLDTPPLPGGSTPVARFEPRAGPQPVSTATAR